MVLGIPHLRNQPTKHHFPAVPRHHVERLDARRVVVLKLRSGTLQQVELVDVQIQRPGPDKRKTNETKGWSAERSPVRKRIDINIYISKYIYILCLSLRIYFFYIIIYIYIYICTLFTACVYIYIYSSGGWSWTPSCLGLNCAVMPRRKPGGPANLFVENRGQKSWDTGWCPSSLAKLVRLCPISMFFVGDISN